MAPFIQFVANDIRLEGVAVELRLGPDCLARELAGSDVRARRGAGEGAQLTGRMSRSDNDIVVRCRVTAAVEADCVRCLEPASFDVSAEISLLLQPATHPRTGKGAKKGSARKGRPASEEPEEYEFQGAEAEIDRYDGETVVLDYFVREAILLEMPNFPLCSEGCPGIRPSPEADDRTDEPAAVDPRLAPLGAFRKQLVNLGPATLDDLVAAAAERSVALGRPVLRSHHQRAKKKKK